ncbi:hypothetical protein [Bradyrhizobium liaoningense]|uniref:hypothetical protein n=1 Tax=Bradyrhizobium liaoningense TaxID=43992 RepID=UPI001BA70AFF|nr:hypothetical protein [Bradyrhizobium liaoningense]MBR0855451.1 hypothetical protein [Bradyrhizobium liaoningense]
MRQVSEAAPHAATNPSVDFLDLVTWGIQRHAEADRLKYPFIFVSELYPGSERLSSRIELTPSVARFLRKLAEDDGRACVLLARSETGWSVSEFAHCAADDLDAINDYLRDVTSQQEPQEG